MHLWGTLSNLNLKKLLSNPTPVETPVRPRQRIRQPNTRLSDDEVRRLLSRYEAGISLNDLAIEFNLHESTVRAHARRAGLSRRPANEVSEAKVAEAVRLYVDERWSIMTISKSLGMDRDTVARRLRAAGVQIRGRGRPHGFRPGESPT